MTTVVEQQSALDLAAFHLHLKRLGMATGVLLVCFSLPLLRLGSFAIHSELFSYILLVPVISGYLIWTERKHLKLECGASWAAAIGLFVAAAALLVGYWAVRHSGAKVVLQDSLAWLGAAEICVFWGLCLRFLGWRMVRQIAFPLGFLIFMVPMPTAALDAIDAFFQYTSAMAATGFCVVVGTPVMREGLTIHLPGQSLTVAPECSGIHSTMVLVMTSLLGGYLFTSKFVSRATLLLVVIPLAILRNGFRIFVVGELCVHIGPQMINSPIHRHGGPIFFALSLIPLFLLLFLMRKWEMGKSNVKITENC